MPITAADMRERSLRAFERGTQRDVDDALKQIEEAASFGFLEKDLRWPQYNYKVVQEHLERLGYKCCVKPPNTMYGNAFGTFRVSWAEE